MRLMSSTPLHRTACDENKKKKKFPPHLVTRRIFINRKKPKQKGESAACACASSDHGGSSEKKSKKEEVIEQLQLCAVRVCESFCVCKEVCIGGACARPLAAELSFHCRNEFPQRGRANFLRRVSDLECVVFTLVSQAIVRYSRLRAAASQCEGERAGLRC